jgi:hypothetical protein
MAPQSKSQNEKHKMILNQLLQKEENKYCADCGCKSPRYKNKKIFQLLNKSKMGELELGHIYVHSLLWNPPRNGRAHLQSKICKFRHMDSRTNAGNSKSAYILDNLTHAGKVTD